MGVDDNPFALREQWSLQDALQFREIHAVGGGRFLLSGGLDAPTLPQDKIACAIALADSASPRFLWKTAYNRHKPFDFSCPTNTAAIGAIPNRFKSDFSGLMRFDLSTGIRLSPDIPATGIQGVASFGDDSFAYATWTERSTLVIHHGNVASHHELSTDRNIRVARLTSFTDGKIIVSLQHTHLAHGKGTIAFLHQMRTSAGALVWEHRSLNDSVTVSPDFARVFTYPNAGLESVTSIETLDSVTGKALTTFTISSPVANLVAATSDILLFCNAWYELCAYSLHRQQMRPLATFPNDVPGWLSIAVDHTHRTVMACKANNFMSPKTFVSTFRY